MEDLKPQGSREGALKEDVLDRLWFLKKKRARIIISQTVPLMSHPGPATIPHHFPREDLMF
jgi:hypothetical protein